MRRGLKRCDGWGQRPCGEGTENETGIRNRYKNFLASYQLATGYSHAVVYEPGLLLQGAEC